ncbi:MAG: BON domain-containing protein [Acidobacteria bacterium]|nr:MAG: BON domain-containing protein [Acidobacteriota bacterium]REK02642.1 MAG: BON domain-containing protein [Acidobacteriota bacterium]REK13554.1 MAG: BON domain-containing protein [Acidobacteriota bacterium]REK41548.1 MAG: BON domain-containing protein [Acidobacteriota bacterium]
MKSIRTYLIVAIVILGISVVSVSAQTSGSSVLLENKVSKELRKLPYYGVFDHIAFEVEGSTVMLYGKVLNGINRKNAENYIKDIDGVSEVVNNIEILSGSSFDNSIRRRTVRAFYNSGSLYRYLQGPNPPVRIIVDGGRLILFGYMSNRGDIRLANIVAQGVPGTFGVTNNLELDSK